MIALPVYLISDADLVENGGLFKVIGMEAIPVQGTLGGGGGGGDMDKATYDTDDNGIVDGAEQLNDGTNTTTALEVRNHIDDAAKHREINDAGVATTDLWSADKITTELSTKQDVLSEGAFVDGDKTKLDGIEAGAEVNDVNSVNGQTGAVTLDAGDVEAIPELATTTNVNTNYDLLSTDLNKLIMVSGSVTITLPDGLNTGFQATIVNKGGGTITIAADTTLNTINGATTLSNQYGAVVVFHEGANVWYGFGDLV